MNTTTLPKGFFSVDLSDGRRQIFPTWKRKIFIDFATKNKNKVISIGWSNTYDGYGDPIKPEEYEKTFDRVLHRTLLFAERHQGRGW